MWIKNPSAEVIQFDFYGEWRPGGLKYITGGSEKYNPVGRTFSRKVTKEWVANPRKIAGRAEYVAHCTNWIEEAESASTQFWLKGWSYTTVPFVTEGSVWVYGSILLKLISLIQKRCAASWAEMTVFWARKKWSAERTSRFYKESHTFSFAKMSSAPAS